MNPELGTRLAELAEDFSSVGSFGKPFRYFHCPILGVDEDVPLQKGHIINQGFKNSARTWVPQRKDVDSFYGTHFEAEFQLLQYKDAGLTFRDVLTDPQLSRKLGPEFYLNGERVGLVSRPGKPTPSLTPATFYDETNQPVELALKMTLDEFVAASSRSWAVGFEKDTRLGTFVSAIKAAHLSAFYLMGYRYALGTAGWLFGPDLLGRFFREARDMPRAEVRRHVEVCFKDFGAAVRPILGFTGGDRQGSITDMNFFLCRGSSGSYWGILVHIKIAHHMLSVMLPNGSSADTIATYLDFMQNDNETIHVANGQLNLPLGRFEVSSEALPLHWPKKDSPFDPINRKGPSLPDRRRPECSDLALKA